ncbi:MAG: Rdx family protein [Actinomycetota bacterium]
MSQVEIEYCVECGLLPKAEETEHAVLEAYGNKVDGLTFKPGHGGVFKVSIDGEPVYDKSDEGYDLNSIVERVGARL